MSSRYVDTTAIMQVIGCVYNTPQLLEFTDKYTIVDEDFPDEFHKIAFGAIYKIHELGAKKITLENVSDFLSSRPKSAAVFKQQKGEEWLLKVAEASMPSAFDYYYSRLKKFSLLRAYDNCGVDVSDIYDPDNILDTKKKQLQEDTLDNSTLDENIFVVNKDYSKVIFEKHFDNPLEFLGYDTIGIKLSIYANLQTLTQKAVSGKYRIKIVFRGLDQTKCTSLNFTGYEDKVRYINMEDMIVIDPYFTAGYCNQEKTFDIKDFAVSAIIVSIVQSKADEETFLDQDGLAVNSDSFFIKTKNLYCAFGYK